MKFLTVFVIAFLAIQAVSASTVADRLKQKITQVPAVESISATSLQGSPLSSSAALAGSLSGSLSASLSASTSSVPTVSSQSASASTSGGCVQQSPCSTVTESGAGLSVQDAVKPVDDWLKDFKARAGADGADLLKAAKATVSPLIDRLRQNQDHALEKLHDSNEEILHKVEEATTEHIYNILKSQQQKEAKEVAAETKKAELDAVKEEANQKKLEVALAAESSAAVAAASGSSGSSGSKKL